MEFELKTGPQGHVYLPKLIRKNFGNKLKLFPDNFAGVIYADGTKTEDVIASLEVIIQHLKLRNKPLKAVSSHEQPER
ncbi:MAG: hypothetical protein ACPLIG_00030 [Candidatus Bathyarchaeales archaeon]